MERLERIFGLREAGSTVGTELRAGATTFLTLSYILFVNPQILSRRACRGRTSSLQRRSPRPQPPC